MSCQACAGRSRLLVRLGAPLDFLARDPERLLQTLALPDELLIAALGGRRREELKRWHSSRPEDDERSSPAGVERVCRHDADYPSMLRGKTLAPYELHVLGGAHSVLATLERPAVAIIGSRRCTDYGLEVARCLARDLAAAGIPLLSELSPGIAHSAQIGALEANGATIALMSGGLNRCPERCESVYRQLPDSGCLVSELPWGARSRIWSELGRIRTLALLAQLVVVVEAQSGPRELACARLAEALGRKIAAVPGRVTSPASEGTNLLLREGVDLVRCAEDALDLLYGASPRPQACSQLEPRLREVLRLIGEGRDTIVELVDGSRGQEALLGELAELELKGLLRRGDGARYVPCAVTACK